MANGRTLWTRLRASMASLTIGFVAAAGFLATAEAGESGPNPPRLALVDGDVSFWRDGSEDWTPARLNTPLAAGDALYTGNGGNAELQIGARAFIRTGARTEIRVDSLEPNYLQLRMTSGRLMLDLPRLPNGQQIEVDTPNSAIVVERAGLYRVDVDDGTVLTVRNGGTSTLIPAGGEAVEIGSDQRVIVDGTDVATLSRGAAPGLDDWDGWNVARTGSFADRPASAAYVSPEIPGVDELDRAGEWRDTPSYGRVWVPAGVPAGWAPYSTGNWVYDPYYQWTWIDEAPWGWAPYHYGRWCYVDNYWGWAPGPIVAAPAYAPALVAFFGGGGVSVGVSIGVPAVSWVALGYGEPITPWWGPVGFSGRPYWGGWGGPRIVNNIVINNNTRIVRIDRPEHYRNFRVRNAVWGAGRDHFGRGHGRFERVSDDRARGLRPFHGSIGVKPAVESLSPSRGERGRRPPERVDRRQVVATRPPADSSRRLASAGLKPAGSTAVPPSKIVERRNPSRGSERGGAVAARGKGREGDRPQSSAGRDHGRREAPPVPGHRGEVGSVERNGPSTSVSGRSTERGSARPEHTEGRAADRRQGRREIAPPDKGGLTTGGYQQSPRHQSDVGGRPERMDRQQPSDDGTAAFGKRGAVPPLPVTRDREQRDAAPARPRSYDRRNSGDAERAARPPDISTPSHRSGAQTIEPPSAPRRQRDAESPAGVERPPSSTSRNASAPTRARERSDRDESRAERMQVPRSSNREARQAPRVESRPDPPPRAQQPSRDVNSGDRGGGGRSGGGDGGVRGSSSRGIPSSKHGDH